MNPEDNELLNEWFIQSNIRKSTQESYTIAMNRYCKLTRKTPTELLEEAEAEEMNTNIKKRRRKIKSYLLTFINQLNEEIAPTTARLYYYAIRSFYKSFDVDLPNVKIEKGDITLEENRSRGMTKENILKLANASSPRERALVYLMSLSGMGQQEARNLTIKQILEAASIATHKQLENVNDLFKNENELADTVLPLHIRRQKVNYDHHTFIPPEATREIINYLKKRCYGRNSKIRITSNNDFVFVNNVGNKLSRDSIVTNFRRTGEKAGFKREKGSFSFWRSHSLRAYFITTFINKTGEKILADYLAGHTISQQDRSYWKANPSDLEKHYLKVLPDLTLDKAKVRDVKSSEFKTLTAELNKQTEETEELKTQMEFELAKKDEEIALMNKKVKDVEKQIKLRKIMEKSRYPNDYKKREKQKREDAKRILKKFHEETGGNREKMINKIRNIKYKKPQDTTNPQKEENIDST